MLLQYFRDIDDDVNKIEEMVAKLKGFKAQNMPKP